MKNILLFSTGLSPQIITESLYYHTQISKISIHEIHVITDKTGKELIDKHLLSNNSWYNKLLDEYNIDNNIIFNQDTVHVIKNEKNQAITDLKTLKDNNFAVEQIFVLIKELTLNDNTRLISSIAGGRKSLSVILGQALQFFARKEDILTHVIVDDGIVGSYEFFYPTKISQSIEHRGKTFDAKKVKIYLDQIPFIRLRGLLDKKLIAHGKGLHSLVKTAQIEIDNIDASIKIQIKGNRLYIAKKAIKMQAKCQAIYELLLRVKIDKYQEDSHPMGYINPERILSLKMLKEYYDLYQKKYSKTNIYLEQEKARIQNEKERDLFFTLKWLQETRSKINKTLEKQLTPLEYSQSQIQSIGSRFNVLYGIPLNRKHIRI